MRVVDLSADFRLRDAAVYGEWYREHPVPELIEAAVYGLPELYREQIARGRPGGQSGLLSDRHAARAGPAGP